MPHEIEQPGRTLGAEQLCLHGDPSRVGAEELADGGHSARLGGIADGRRGEVPVTRGELAQHTSA